MDGRYVGWLLFACLKVTGEVCSKNRFDGLKLREEKICILPESLAMLMFVSIADARVPCNAGGLDNISALNLHCISGGQASGILTK